MTLPGSSFPAGVDPAGHPPLPKPFEIACIASVSSLGTTTIVFPYDATFGSASRYW
jgi:hypothetical protein